MQSRSETCNGDVPEANPDERFIDVSTLFREFDIHDRITVLFNRHTYEVDPDVPKNNWLHPAFRGFQILKERLKEEGLTVETFASVGTGSGLDGVYGQRIFGADRVVLTDSHPKVIELADRNVRENIPKGINLQTLCGNLCEPLKKAGIRPDVLYANLPLIPDDDIETGMRSSTFVRPDVLRDVPEMYQRRLLGMKHALLRSAYDVLTPNGSVVINLGGRVPIELVQIMFAECGYTYEELFTMLKVQSQPAEVLPSFMKAEDENGIEFDFYALENIDETLRIPSPGMHAEKFKELLREDRISAASALERHERGEKVGHIVQVIRGRRFTDDIRTYSPYFARGERPFADIYPWIDNRAINGFAAGKLDLISGNPNDEAHDVEQMATIVCQFGAQDVRDMLPFLENRALAATLERYIRAAQSDAHSKYKDPNEKLY